MEKGLSKLIKVMKFLRIIKSKILTLEADDTGNLY